MLGAYPRRPPATTQSCRATDHGPTRTRAGHYGTRISRVICAANECERVSTTRGYCNIHYQRWLRHGDANAARPVGDAHHAWKGDDAGYAAIHHRLKITRGRAADHLCPCGKQAYEWAFDEPVGYSTDLDRYTALCHSCHKLLDNRSELCEN
jgi:hypothetical protein